MDTRAIVRRFALCAPVQRSTSAPASERKEQLLPPTSASRQLELCLPRAAAPLPQRGLAARPRPGLSLLSQADLVNPDPRLGWGASSLRGSSLAELRSQPRARRGVRGRERGWQCYKRSRRVSNLRVAQGRESSSCRWWCGPRGGAAPGRALPGALPSPGGGGETVVAGACSLASATSHPRLSPAGPSPPPPARESFSSREGFPASPPSPPLPPQPPLPAAHPSAGPGRSGLQTSVRSSREAASLPATWTEGRLPCKVRTGGTGLAFGDVPVPSVTRLACASKQKETRRPGQ